MNEIPYTPRNYNSAEKTWNSENEFCFDFQISGEVQLGSKSKLTTWHCDRVRFPRFIVLLPVIVGLKRDFRTHHCAKKAWTSSFLLSSSLFFHKKKSSAWVECKWCRIGYMLNWEEPAMVKASSLLGIFTGILKAHPVIDKIATVYNA